MTLKNIQTNPTIIQTPWVEVDENNIGMESFYITAILKDGKPTMLATCLTIHKDDMTPENDLSKLKEVVEESRLLDLQDDIKHFST